MTLADRSMITPFMTSAAAMPTPADLCDVITVNTGPALPVLDRCPREIVRLCLPRGYRSSDSAPPSSELTASRSAAQFNSP
jgi:hypothetical protein